MPHKTMVEHSLEETIQLAIVALKTPAGACRRNREAFVIACHRTWKDLQTEAVEQILMFESIARRKRVHPIGRGVAGFADYNRTVWRRVSDAIVWSLFGVQRHVVKRLCLYRPRGYLSESNATSALTTVAALNANQLSFAIWNDATSCVDIGDVTYIEDGREPAPEFIELKEGRVNDEIISLLGLEGVKFEDALQVFTERYGNEGVKQFHRVLRQKRTSDQALALLANEHGLDPATGSRNRNR